MPKLFFPSGTITIDGDAHTAEVSSAVLTPTTPTSAFTDVGGNTATSVGLPVWALALTIGQDWITDGSLSRLMIERHGEVVPVVYVPQNGGAGFTVQAILIAGSVGGTGGQQATSQVSLPVEGQPEIAPAAG